jgi:hypothetical protein
VVHTGDSGLDQGDKVRAEVSPRVGYLRSLKVTQHVATHEPVAAVHAMPFASMPDLVSALSNVVGEPVEAGRSVGRVLYNAVRGRVAFKGATTEIWVQQRRLEGDLHQAFADFSSSVAPVRSLITEVVDDVGDEAGWIAGSILVARQERTAVAVHIESHRPGDDSKARAIGVAQWLFSSRVSTPVDVTGTLADGVERDQGRGP